MLRQAFGVFKGLHIIIFLLLFHRWLWLWQPLLQQARGVLEGFHTFIFLRLFPLRLRLWQPLVRKGREVRESVHALRLFHLPLQFWGLAVAAGLRTVFLHVITVLAVAVTIVCPVMAGRIEVPASLAHRWRTPVAGLRAVRLHEAHVRLVAMTKLSPTHAACIVVPAGSLETWTFVPPEEPIYVDDAFQETPATRRGGILPHVRGA
mmetsp:Transcript_50405/g.158715  ORF Transcript_50405/g.158715 Transcript_50405/m.158715 type:complete len:206 (+) Transcript_50405:130-747(+)